jgi:4-aminobutyrate aminotransferase-like enzyme
MVLIILMLTCQKVIGSSIDKVNTKPFDYDKQELIKTKEGIISKSRKGQKLNLQTLQSIYWIRGNSYTLTPKVDQENFLMKNIRPIFKPLIVSGSGATLYTNENKDIIDFSSMNVNCILGQNDVWVKLNQAAYILSDRPSFHSRRFGSEVYYEIPKLLADARIGGISDPLINHKQANGSDVVELAINAAFSKKGKRKYIVSFLGSYHGQNLTSCIISDKKKEHKFLNCKGDKVVFLDSPPNEIVWTVPDVLEKRELSYEEEKIIRKLESIAKDTYVIILEPIQGNNGLRMFSLPLIKKIKEISVKYDICLIFDEIQTGFGWLGKMTAAELYGISPDILLLSKGLTAGNGPLSIAIFSGKYKESITDGTSEKTNGADLRSLVAVKAVFERLNGISNPEDIPNSLDKNMRRELKDGLLIGYNKKVRLIEDSLTKLIHNHKEIISKKVGMGLIRGFQVKPIGNLNSVEVAKKIIDLGLPNGVALGRSNDVVMIRPPLVISDSELYTGFHRLSKTLNSIENSKSNF